MPLIRCSFARASCVTLVALLSACSGATGPTTGAVGTVPTTTTTDTLPPALMREMRGLWVATVANIDWPSRTTLTADQQKAELTSILDRAQAGGLNAVLLQVRPAADALYQSSIEPWASMLTGTQGQSPGYDPLAFAVTEAHARGLELHAWINPFRAGTARDTAKLAPTHLFTSRRDLLRVYGAQLWLDPGEPAVHDHVIRVVQDILARYDVDAIHADDYFYPYVEIDAAGKAIDFPDSASYARSGSTLSRADWRRANVDRFVQRLYTETHAARPRVKVGISPFGIWRSGTPPGIVGLDAFSSIYADSRKWLQQGWVDYFAPQLYWAIAPPQQSFPVLLDWWVSQNTMGRHVWPGLASYRVADGTASAFSGTEIPDQVKLARARTTGHLLYNTNTTLTKNSGAVIGSLASLYTDRALPPAFAWLDATAPGMPSIRVASRIATLTPAAGQSAPRWWAIRSRSSSGWSTRVIFGDKFTYSIDAGAEVVTVNAVSQTGIVSPTATWRGP